MFCILYPFSFYFLCKLTEQYAKEQLDTEALSGKTSNLDIKVPESTVEVTLSKNSLSLSLLDDVDEVVVQDSFPEEVHLDVTVESDDITEGKDYSKQSKASITNIHG